MHWIAMHIKFHRCLRNQHVVKPLEGSGISSDASDNISLARRHASDCNGRPQDRYRGTNLRVVTGQLRKNCAADGVISQFGNSTMMGVGQLCQVLPPCSSTSNTSELVVASSRGIRQGLVSPEGCMPEFHSSQSYACRLCSISRPIVN
ncbi:hypothetical protein D3C74_366560 [compost metagenome]